MAIKGNFQNNWFVKTAISGVMAKILPAKTPEDTRKTDNSGTRVSENELCEVRILDDEPKTVNVSMHELVVGEFDGVIGNSNHPNLNFNIEFTADGVMNDITKDNVVRIIKSAGAMGDGTFFDQLFESENLSKKQKVDGAIYVVKCLQEKAVKEGFYDNIGNLISEAIRNLGAQDESDSFELDAAKVNEISEVINSGIYETIQKDIEKQGISGEIDEDFSQGDIGDCWLLASIKSISYTPKGQEILKNCISVNEEGAIAVTLQGVGKTYTITRDEFKENKNYSQGDGDVKAIEMAVEKYMKENNIGNGTIEEGGWDGWAFNILIDSSKAVQATDVQENGANIIKKAKEPNFICTVSCQNTKDDWVKDVVAQDEKGNNIQIRTYHAYSVVNSDDKFVYIINPWDSGTTLKLTHDDFMNAFNKAAVYDLF